MTDQGSLSWHPSKPYLLGSLLHFELVQVATAVAQVAYGTVGVQLVEQREVDIRHENHLGVGRCFCSLAVVGECEVARSEHCRLGILYVHVVNARQVAHASGYCHVALVLDGACLGTVSNVCMCDPPESPQHFCSSGVTCIFSYMSTVPSRRHRKPTL